MPEDVTEAFEIDQQTPIIVHATHTGHDHFGLKISSVSGRMDERLINTIGDFDGTVMAPIKPGKYVFEIDYGTEYTLEMTDFGEIRSPPFSYSQTDPDVVAIEIENPIKLNLTAKNDDHVGVTLRNHLGQNVDRLVNEIGPVETSSMIRQEGQAFLFFDIRGEWEAEINEI